MADGMKQNLEMDGGVSIRETDVNASTATSSMPQSNTKKSAEDLAELERLSNEYSPAHEGALVGNLQSSKALEVEYANADPVYVRKTKALSPKYSSYRIVRGDGNCAWRALAFGYFELLLRGGSKALTAEYERMKSLNELLNKAGYQEYIYEDFADSTFTLLQTLASSAEEQKDWDDTLLVTELNDEGTSNAIITHFKMLTSAWMRTHAENYEPFLDRPIKEYCDHHIEPYNVEAEHVGISALIDCVFLPANLAVEVIYLDRSAGDEVNVHQFGKMDDEKTPVLRLLYRPGHYDILYKKGEVPEPSPGPAKPVQVSGKPTKLNIIQQTSDHFVPEDYGSDDDDDDEYDDTPIIQTPISASPSFAGHYLSDHFQPQLYNPKN